MKKFVIAAVLALSMGSAAQALPMVNVTADNTMLVHVAQGCGPGGHRGPYGHCRPMFSCPRGWHSGPYGQRCFRNRGRY